MVLCPLPRAVNPSCTDVIPTLTSTFLSLSQQESLRLIMVTYEIKTGKGNLTSSHGCISSSEWKNKWFLLETSPSIANVGPNWLILVRSILKNLELRSPLHRSSLSSTALSHWSSIAYRAMNTYGREPWSLVLLFAGAFDKSSSKDGEGATETKNL